jgi:hypothetical protein
MKSRDDLFQIIASLTRAEKRYFKIYAGRHVIGGQNRYVKLFDLIDRQAEYDHDKLRKSYKGDNLSSDKNYLKKLLLKSMRAFRDGGHVRTRLQEFLEEAHFLKEKGLYDQCLRMLKKARKMAEEYECFYQLLEIMDLERRLVKQTVDSDMQVTQEKLARKQENSLQWISTELKFAHLYDRLFLYSRLGRSREGDIPKVDLELLEKGPGESEESPEVSVETRIQYHSSRVIYCNLRKDYPQSLAEVREIVRLYEAHPKVKEKNSDRYKIALSNLLVAANAADHHEDFPETLEKIRALPALSFDEEAETFQNLAFLELIYFMNSGQFDQVPSQAEQVDAALDEYADKINQARMHALCLNFSLAFFIREEMRHSLSWLGRILNHKSGDQRQDIQQAARILQLVIHLEAGNHDLIHSLLRSTRRYLDLNQGMNAYETVLIGFFRKAIDLPAGNETLKLYRTTISELESLRAESSWGKLLLCQEITIWLQARVDGVSLLKAFGRSVAKSES